MNLSGNLAFGLTITETLAPDAFESGTTSFSLSSLAAWTYAAGTAAGQCDLRFVKAYTIAASGSQTLTLSALADDLGRTIAFARVRALAIVNTSQVAGDDLTIGNAATHSWAAINSSTTATIPLRSMGGLYMVAMNTTALAVTSGSSDQLLISNPSAHAVTINVAIVGASV